MNHRRTNIQIFKNSSKLRHNQTEVEAKLWQVLRAHQMSDVHFRRQHAIGPYIADFCSPKHKLIIELDGSQHLEQQGYDAERTVFLEAKGYRVLRFWNNDVLDNLDGVLQTILDNIK